MTEDRRWQREMFLAVREVIRTRRRLVPLRRKASGRWGR